MYDTIQQDFDAEKFENLDIESKMENLIFTDFKSTKLRSEYSEKRKENSIYVNNAETTNYESFPSSTNSIVELLSNSVHENDEKRNDEFRNPSILDRFSSAFSFSTSTEKATNFTKISTIEIDNKNGVEMKDNENENGRKNRSILGVKYNDKMKKCKEDYENKLYDYIVGNEKQKIKNLKFNSVQKNINNDFSDNNVDNSDEKVRIVHNLRVLDLTKNKLDAISRFALHCKVQKPYSENVILCLPQYFEKYKKLIVTIMLVLFSSIILLTIVMTISESVSQDSDVDPDTWNK